ncbi:unnamed protein product [Staurois parvus]|uniref:60S ribosomal protein L21 n=1 Tax=Staurois parvus TaxID=386267 RepID=A0ABN9EB68_9NEOB|nr:unnamed protein product [Staurois parvus]
MHINKKGDIVDIKGTGTIQKATPHKYYHGNPDQIYNVTQHANNSKVRFLPKKSMSV